jgi:purine-nucleoside phosphorylase
VTNLAAGMTGEKIDHEQVLAEAAAAAPRLGGLLAGLIQRA